MQNITLDIVGAAAATEKLAREAAHAEGFGLAKMSGRTIVQFVGPDRKTYADLDADGKFELIGEQPRPLPGKMSLGSLNGVADYLKANPDGIDLSKTVVVVHSPTEVFVYVGADGEGRRANPIHAVCVDVAKSFIGEQLDQEDAIIGLMTRFRESDDRIYIRRVIGNLRAEAVKTNGDNGWGQMVATSKGISAGMEEVKNPVMLNPLRSFPEIDCGELPFLVRFKQIDEQGTPSSRVRFIEGDGGAWVSKAKNAIGDYLTKRLADDGIVIAGILR